MVKERDTKQPQVIDSGPRAYRGFTLISPLGRSEIQLIDMRGRVVHAWKTSHNLAAPAQLLPNGNLLCALIDPNGSMIDMDGASGLLAELNWEGQTVWKYQDEAMHHAFYRMPDGNTLVLRWVTTPSDIAAKVIGGVPDTERQGIMWSDALQEITPEGEIAWEWLGYEHLHANLDVICPLCFRREWTHGNSFRVDMDGNIIMSFMQTNTVARISRETGDIEWRWGGLGTLAHPHDVHNLDDGNIMTLGCGGHVIAFEIGESEILVIDPERNQVVWEFKEYSTLDFYSPYLATCQPLPNGNVLICEGDRGRVFEVSQDQNIVWQFINPVYHRHTDFGDQNMLLGAYRYGPDYSGLKGNDDESRKTRGSTQSSPGKKSQKKTHEKTSQTRLTNPAGC